MSVFVDTSALYALLSRDDENHPRARSVLTALRGRDALLVTTNYVVLELSVLVAARLGLGIARQLHDKFLPLMGVRWISKELHMRASDQWLAAGRRQMSLVDWVSFEVMREEGMEEAFAFDSDFARQGFRLLS